ncbi:IclR family transcriptional regulator [Leucobacter denitrificans]|uniref:IclR family transcriptional regulator n=1 Tax=Leucobacter denitrificans TaxID=683042 RepID=A0A7G9S285_9MICO|nr:IclR family transcriptional regulator [Leucobacter denitrificans]QNN61960.1 IclR family transcriptional regulator [Leucobacter denitrificans]
MNTLVSSSGTQVVSRMTRVLRELSTRMPDGTGTSDVARATGLTRPTAHRLLSALAAEGFVDRNQHNGNWLLGPEIYLMGAVAAERYDVTEIAREHVAALAADTGESAFFSVRRGGETVCLVRQDGSFPIRSFVLYEGKRFPLGVASAGLAILSFLPKDAVDRYLADAQLTGEFGDAHDVEAVRERIQETRRLGYAVNPGLIVEGSWGMGAAVFTRSGQPAWALSLTGIEPRFSPERRPELGRLLLEHAHRLTEQLARR